ncbi:MAG: 50S ribosomal protein L30e [Nitrososphaerota archaeon]|nr:50S ribosomal protein L30e [Candidatus Bathyarchaeota archaeon]MDW8049343.1 50S ribosomal protein L30e [Nitrososphaerota archaeon]
MADLDNSIVMAVKTGKVAFGANSALQGAATGKVKLIILSSNCPQKIRDKIEYCCKLSDIPIVVSPRTSIDLGRLCGKPFPLSAIAIRDPGDSDILELAVSTLV